MLIKCKNRIDVEQLFSSTVYNVGYFDLCVYCHKEVEKEYFEYEGESIGQPYRCDCDRAKDELRVKEDLFKSMKKLDAFIDEDKINKSTKEYLISEINRAYEEKDPWILNEL